MSKAAKARSKEKRLKAKRGIRAANKAKYEGWSGTDKNKKRKIGSSLRTIKMAKHAHSLPVCGNIGCLKCSEVAITSKIRTRLLTHGPREAAKLQSRLLG